MKKIFTLSLLAIASLSFAQSFQITLDKKVVSGTTITQKIYPDAKTIIDFGITNKSNVAKQYKVTRTLISPAKVGDGYDIYFCTGNRCYGPNDTVVFVSDTIGIEAGAVLPIPGDGNSYGILTHFNAGPGACVDHVVSYKIWDIEKPTDFAEVKINYTCSTGIKGYDLGDISPGYPNPAKGLITIDYNLKNAPKNAKVVFYDMLGKMVKETPIVNQQGAVKINVADLHTGFYFYNFIVDGKTNNARKLIISAN
ncbi:MAG: T9SS type A sorting domain-containing protein [Bacteroidia bacterium]